MIASTFIDCDDSTSDTWDGYTSNYPCYTVTYFDDGSILRAREAFELWLRSRNWTKAPQVIKPHVYYLSLGTLFNFRIAPRFWTGKNFKKVSA